MRERGSGTRAGRRAGLSIVISLGLALAACAPAAAPSPTAAPAAAKPTEAPAPAGKPAAAPAASPAAGAPAAAPAASPAAAAPAAAKPTEAAPAKLVEKVTLKSAFTSTSATLAVSTAAKEGGFFEEEALDVSLTRIQAGAPILSAMRGGDVPIAFVGAQQIVEANLQGGDFVILAAFIEILGQQIYVAPSIERPEQLKGQSVGVSNFGAITHVAGRLGTEHLGLKDQVNFLATGGPPETLAAMQAGRIQGGIFSPPDSYKARDLGFRLLLDVGTTGAKAVTSSIASTRKYARENPDVVERYIRASIKGSARMINDKDFGMKVIAKHSGIEDPKVLDETYDYYRPQFSKDPIPSTAGMQQAIDLAAEQIPEAKNAKPEQFSDLTILNRIKATGLLDQLFKP